MEESCPYKPRKILTSRQARKEKIGSFYHPTEKTYRNGACPEGYELKKGYERKEYTKKNGTKIKSTYVDPVCIVNKGIPGKLFHNEIQIKINPKNSFEPYNYSTKDNSNIRFKSLLKACKKLSYRTVVRKLVILRLYHKNMNKKLYKIYDEDIKNLQKWRLENPELYKYKST